MSLIPSTFAGRLAGMSLLLAGMHANPIAAEPQQINSWRLYSSLNFKEYQGSRQKYEGKSLDLGMERQLGPHRFRLQYEMAETQTYQPPLPNDLEISKFHLQYQGRVQERLWLKFGGISIQDNIAPTDGGKVYGVGLRYQFADQAQVGFDQYLSQYDDFDVHQSDLSLSKGFRLSSLNARWGATLKYIQLDDDQTNGFSRNAQKNYVTLGTNLGLSHRGYFAGLGAFWGKRAFAVMNKGAKVQHHAMEFDQTYKLELGKKINKVKLSAQYVHQRATELPINNSGVEIDTLSLQMEYRF